MFHVKYILYFILLHLIIATPQFNLFYTDLVNENNNVLQYNCLRTDSYRRETMIQFDENNNYYYEVILYCMNEFSPKFDIEEETNLFPKFTFYELSKQNITSEQLYLWSAPIDLIENYQFYLNQLLTLNDLSYLEMKIFYNCTLPRFGSQCQYEFDYYRSNHSSLNEMIREFYITNPYNPDTLTCYKHLQCNRGSPSTCLDWTEICNGQIDCSDGGFDEEHCWQLQVNQCKDNEYRCYNGQCIPKIFYGDGIQIPDCIDGSDEREILFRLAGMCDITGPTLICQSLICLGGSLTSSCVGKRKDLLMKAMFSIKDNSISEDCWLIMKCIFDGLYTEEPSCRELYAESSRQKALLDSCPDMLYIPNDPILFSDTYIAIGQIHSNDAKLYFYVCYNHSHYDNSINGIQKISFNNRTCYADQFSNFSCYSPAWITIYHKFIDHMHKELSRYHLSFNYTSTICTRSNMYQCIYSSKCITIHRLLDKIIDCPYMDDEIEDIKNDYKLKEQLQKTHFYCQENDKYIALIRVNDGSCDCPQHFDIWCLDEMVDKDSLNKISFQTICDGFQELSVLTNDKTETDEMECEQWECDNIYTHCDNWKNCPNGVDEIGCNGLSGLTCLLNHFLCVSLQTYQIICLHKDKIDDGNFDCIGGIDEQRELIDLDPNDGFVAARYAFRCVGIYYKWPPKLCNDKYDCENGEDEKFCTTDQTTLIAPDFCSRENIEYLSDVDKLMCTFFDSSEKKSIIYFKLDNIIKLVENREKKINENLIFSNSYIIKVSNQHQFRCHHGLNLRVWLNNENNLIVCLCSSNYYGEDCQYQNQRISLAIKFRTLSDSLQTHFAIIISLIDNSDERIIHSYEQINYLSLRYCRTKFQIYLLYSTRPKDSTKNYSIQIDIYEKNIKLIHRGSLLLPINFPFLPVHRLAFLVDIPSISNIKSQICSNDECIHGKCIKYSNNLDNQTFCQCDKGWSGQFCTIQHTCMCSSDSLCVGISANNRSICVCPSNKFGPRCLLTVNTICQINNDTICENGGECIPNNPDIISNQQFTCICPTGYSGDRCEIVDNELILSFDKNIVLSQEIFIHFIEVMKNAVPRRSTIFRRIPIIEDLINITWSQPFHLVFIDVSNKNYYLTVVQNIYNRSQKINKMINPSDRCSNISELFNSTFLQWDLIRRIKYYHLPCQNQLLNLSCFYDEVHFCLCYNFSGKRLANCFNFNHTMTFNCEGQNGCENDGQCFQDHPECPTKSFCMCPSCFFGQRCQLTTNGFGLSLDVILGYQISPHVSINHQRFIIKISLALTIILTITGLVNGILSIITFKNKTILEVGCGLYLLCSSITTLFTTIMFALKFSILLLTHMSIISNQSFLTVQCYLFDFLLRVFLSMDQWLNACVAIERTITVIKGANFDKKKSKRTAKLVISILFIIIVGSCIHDPIHRRSVDEINEDDNRQNRIWCIVSYSSGLEIYNSFIHLFHFIGPFIINLASAIILVVKKTRQQSNLLTQQPYKEILRKTIKEHKNLLTAPIVLVILGVPRIILIFKSKCMKSAGDAWLFLIGYFVSFIPPMLTFIVFILPSTFYKGVFRKTIEQYRNTILRWIRNIQ